MIPELQEQVRHSVQPHPKREEGISGAFLLAGLRNNLPAWGTREMDIKLRRISRETHSTLFSGTRHTLAMQIASTGWLMEGSNRVKAAQQLLQMADFGGGWKNFVSKIVKDYTTYNFGAVIEVIGRGKVDKPLMGRPIGLSVLDPLRCYATGDPEFPVAYRPRYDYWTYGRDIPVNQQYHLMHHTRVFRFVDMPDSEEGYYECGESALFRYYGHWMRQYLLGKYVIENLTDQPPAGILSLNNIRPDDWANAQRQYEYQQQQEGNSLWRNIMELQGLDPQNKIDIDFIPFANIPQGFDYKTYEEIDALRVALAFGVDPQDVQPLSGGLSGTSGQSFVLLSKARGKMQGVLFAEFERFINTRLLPPSLEFSFQPEDADREKAEADKADVWITAINTAPLSEMEKRRVLARVIEVVADVITDPDGEVVELPDDDTRPEATGPVEEVELVSDTEDTEAPPAPTDEETFVDDAEPIQRRRKDYNATRLDFTADVADAIQAFVDGDIERRRFGVVMRGHIAKYGRAAYIDGLKAGGVEVDALESNDLAFVNKMVADASIFVTQLGTSIAGGATINDPEARAELWGNKTLSKFYTEALLAADRNGLFEWVLGSTKEHCTDCLRLQGQRHRIKDWERTGWIPQADRLECNGFHCKCKLVRVAGKSRGRF